MQPSAMSVFPLLLLSVCFLMACGAPGAAAPGVYVANRTESCCGGMKIHIHKECLNRFFIGDMVKGWVNGTKAEALKPFHFLPDDNVMQVLDCVDFTHQSNCDVDRIQEREERIHYQVTPCPKQDGAPNAAAADQGSVMCLLLTVSLLMAKFR